MYYNTKLIKVFHGYNDNKVATYVLDSILIFSDYFDETTETRQTYGHLGKFKGMERQYKMNLSCSLCTIVPLASSYYWRSQWSGA